MKKEEGEEVLFVTMDHNITMIMQNEVESIVGGRIVRQPQRSFQFHGEHYRTSDPDEIEHLRNHGTFGRRIFEGPIPDDIVQVGAEVAKFVCSYPDCNEVLFTMEQMKQHKQESHSKKKVKKEVAVDLVSGKKAAKG